MKLIPTLLLCFFLPFTLLHAQLSSADVLQKMQKLGNTASVLYIAAHPDDENTRLLSYLSKELNFRTAYLSLTRGDGGQNLVGPETEEELGLIRTQELLAARRIDGAEQFFTRAFDFGYSKTPEETFAIWNRDSVLHDVVWVIRKFRPDIIITRFPTTGEGGHGHHTASAMLAIEAFNAAADPKRFPKQLKHTTVWKAKRVYWNNFMPSRDEKTDTRNMLKMDVGAFNQNLGLSVGEIASMSRSQHKSQGFGVKMQRGEVMEYFTYLAGDSAKITLFDGLSTSWSRYPNGAEITVAVQQLIRDYDPYNAAASIAVLVQLDEKIRSIADSAEYRIKHREIEDILLVLGGVYQDFTSPKYEYNPGDTLTATYGFIFRRGNMVNLVSLKVPGLDEPIRFGERLKGNLIAEKRIKFQIPQTTNTSNPYWLKNPHGEGLFVHPEFTQTGQPDSDPELWAEATISVNGLLITRRLPLIYKWVDPVKGEQIRRTEIVPSLRGSTKQQVLLNDGTQNQALRIDLEYLQQGLKGEILLKVPERKGIRVTPARIAIDANSKKKETIQFSIEMSPSREIKEPFHEHIQVLFLPEGAKEPVPVQETRRIVHDHIPTQTWHKPLSLPFTYAPLQRKVQRIGYVEGAGDDVAEALIGAGYEVEILNDAQIRTLQPANFEAVVVGIRALNSKEEMAEWMPLLLEYTRKGGTLVLQYNTRNWISDVKVTPGPYPFEISRNRVTNEKSAVRFSDPKHPILNFPNAITQNDFDQWVQERGIYFAEKCDPKYADLLAMADPNENELTGSLLYATYGEGHFIYTGLSFFRQLPAGVPGAFRLFANFLAIGKHEKP